MMRVYAWKHHKPLDSRSSSPIFNAMALHLIKQFLGRPEMASFHRVVAGTFVVNAVMMALSLMVSIQTTRQMGVEGRALFSWIMAYSGFGVIFVIFGIG